MLKSTCTIYVVPHFKGPTYVLPFLRDAM